MDIRKLTERVYVAPQISAEDLPVLAKEGFVRVICNRPDPEVPPSHQAEAISEAADAAGLEFFVRPLTHQTMTEEIIAENFALLGDCNGPVLAYCASGTRSTIAWALGAAKEMPVDDILDAARRGGYELSHLRGALEAARRF